jgi:hypothetical protein
MLPRNSSTELHSMDAVPRRDYAGMYVCISLAPLIHGTECIASPPCKERLYTIFWHSSYELGGT